MKPKFSSVLILALALPLGSGAATAQSISEPIVVAQANTQAQQRGNAQARPRRAARPSADNTPERQIRNRINAWVVGVAAGKLEGAPIRLVEEMSRVVDDGDNMQVLPIITRGPSYNVHALLYLRGIDLAVINGDVLEFFGKQQNISRINQRINYVTQLFNSEVHVLVRPEIKSLEDLAGKSVNFNTKGTSAAFSGPSVFDKLGIKIKKTFVPHPIAMQQMKKSDKYAAVVFVTGKPVRPLVKKKWPEGFRLLPVPFSEKVADFFLPSVLTSKDYPDLIAPGQQVQTIAVPTVLAAFNWSKNHVRGKRVERFVEYLFKRWDRLQKPPFDPKWKEINLAAKIPGWNRLPAVQKQLDKRKAVAGARIDRDFVRNQARQAAPGNPAEQERLFQEFMQWYRTQQRTPQQARRQ
ncbi:MAG: TAXI family TRAP transporter solute-binding subunit [Methyloligellaceae bacterium]